MSDMTPTILVSGLLFYTKSKQGSTDFEAQGKISEKFQRLTLVSLRVVCHGKAFLTSLKETVKFL